MSLTCGFQEEPGSSPKIVGPSHRLPARPTPRLVRATACSAFGSTLSSTDHRAADHCHRHYKGSEKSTDSWLDFSMYYCRAWLRRSLTRARIVLDDTFTATPFWSRNVSNDAAS